MQPDFWHDRWQSGVIGFHRTQVNPHLLEFWPGIAKPPAQVLVPLCGKSLDLLWLSRQGYQVLGVELSELAVQAFFSEAGLQPLRRTQGAFECWQAGNIRILCGDFFALTANDVSGCSLIYDRAALIALPQDMRIGYARRLLQVCPSASMLLEVLDYPQQQMQGPPFSVSVQELAMLFQGVEMRLLQEQDILSQEPKLRDRGVNNLVERVYALAWSAQDDKLCAN